MFMFIRVLSLWLKKLFIMLFGVKNWLKFFGSMLILEFWVMG